MFYIKRISESHELCLVYGWVGDGKYSLFTRAIETQDTIEDFGILDSQKAWEIFNAAEVWKE